jgi:hypothetical protein
MPCEGNRMISIEQGRYQDVDLAGVQLLVTFNMRNWSKIYVSDKVSDRQMKAVEAMLPLAFAGSGYAVVHQSADTMEDASRAVPG